MSVPEPAEKDRTRERPVAPIGVRIVLEPHTVWRAGWVVVGVVALALVARWILADGGSVIFTLILSFLASVAMEPAVARLSLRMRRGVAAMIVMVAFIAACALFLVISAGCSVTRSPSSSRACPPSPVRSSTGPTAGSVPASTRRA